MHILQEYSQLIVILILDGAFLILSILFSNNDNAIASIVVFYPNASKGRLNFNTSLNIKQVSIWDFNGRLVQEINDVTNRIDLNQLDAGMYIIGIETQEDNYFFEKLILE